MTAALRDCFASVTPGLEGVAERELRALRLADVVGESGGVAFRAADAALFGANLHLRSVSRVLVRIASFTAKSFAELERRAKSVPWPTYVTPGARVVVRVTCRKSRLYHSDAVGERLAKSLTAAVRDVEIGRAPKDDGDAESSESHGASAWAKPVPAPPPQLFVVRLDHDVCTISADSSGELLHRRGYRLAVAKAPIRETIAAGVLLALGYDGSAPLVDPMCGSGTFAIEAALIARNIAPGIHRTFSCEAWPGFDAKVGKRARTAARAAQRPAAFVPILASDRDAGAIAATIANAERAGVAGDITIARLALSAIDPPPGSGLLVANPPYGARVGERASLRNLYAQIGNVARVRLPGWRIALVSADRSLEAHVKLPFEDVLAFSNGGIRVRLVATPPDGSRKTASPTPPTRPAAR